MQRVDLGDRRLRPEDGTDGESGGRDECRDSARLQPSRDHVGEGDGEAAAQRGEQVDAVGERADRDEREWVGHKRVERLARVVGDTEDAAEKLEHRRVHNRY
jgi:hypothetical protein